MISVIIPVLDRPRHVQNAVASVLAQTSLDPGELEIVVVDDASAAPLTLPPAEMSMLYALPATADLPAHETPASPRAEANLSLCLIQTTFG